MKSIDCEVVARDTGERKRAQQIICDHCDDPAFVIYIIDGHNHFQCINCDTTYCDGNCPGPKGELGA